MGIGIRIRELRLRAGLTQEGLAAKIGVTPSTVGNYERDVSFPKEDAFMALFEALNCTPNELLGGEARRKRSICVNTRLLTSRAESVWTSVRKASLNAANGKTPWF